MTTEHTLSAILAEIQDALVRRDFESLSKAIGDASLEQCHFSKRSILSPSLEYYARWWHNRRQNAKALEVYKFVVAHKKLYPASIHYYQSALVRDGQRGEAINVCLQGTKDNPDYPITYMDLGNLYLAADRWEDARQAYQQAKAKEISEIYKIDEKLRHVESLLGGLSGALELWAGIKDSNFALAGAAADNPPKVDFAKFMRLADNGDSHFAVRAVAWGQDEDAAVDFVDRDAVAAGIAFQSEAVDGTLQAYQYEAVKNGEMRYLCPRTGREVKSSHSIYMDRFMATAYFFNAETPFFLLVERVNAQRNGLYFPRQEIYLHFFPADYRYIKAEAAYILATNAACCVGLKYLLTTKWPMFRQYFARKNDLAILSNVHHMMGHSLLNEYPSLNCLFEHKLLTRATRVLSGLEAFFTIRDVFNLDLDHEVHLAERESMTDYVVNNHLFVIRPGNMTYRLPASLRRRVREGSNRLCGEAIRQRFNKEDFAFTVWFEVRTNDHICLNQEALACDVVEYLEGKGAGRIAVFIAGWSRKLSADTALDTRMIGRDAEVADRIAGKLSSLSNAACFSIVGRTLYEKIAWAQLADVHICVYGSGINFACLADRPMIVHASTGWYPTIQQETHNIDITLDARYVVEKEFITISEDQPANVKANARNYACKPEGLLRQLDKVLADLGRPR